MIVSSVHPTLPSVPFLPRPAGTWNVAYPTSFDIVPKAANANAAPSSQRDTIFGNIDLLDLSFLARLLLNGLGDGFSIGTGFLFTPEQQQQFDAIIAKHQGEVFTQENFVRLLEDLRVAGLAPDQLALQDHLRFFDLTSVLLDAVDGNNPGIDFSMALNNLATPILPDQQANSNQYLLYIINQWQGISLVA